jgi:hypothetical protein
VEERGRPVCDLAYQRELPSTRWSAQSGGGRRGRRRCRWDPIFAEELAGALGGAPAAAVPSCAQARGRTGAARVRLSLPGGLSLSDMQYTVVQSAVSGIHTVVQYCSVQ